MLASIRIKPLRKFIMIWYLHPYHDHAAQIHHMCNDLHPSIIRLLAVVMLVNQSLIGGIAY